MKARNLILALPLVIGMAFAQASGSGSSTPSQSDQSNTTKTTTKTTTSATSSGQPAEMKTMTYKGTLVDLGCGGGAQTASTTPSTASATAAANPPSANRSANETSSASSASCAVSANTSQFGLKTDSGQVYRFDMVGNQRAQDEFKTNKHWSNDASASKPLKVKVSGVVQGDKLIVSSIH